MSITTSRTLCIVLCVTVGVVASRRLDYQGNDAATKPIELAEARRICASLCIAGLGGKPCGETCASIQPAEFSRQSGGQLQAANRSGDDAVVLLSSMRGASRRDACPLLCPYQLGEPLCQCAQVEVEVDSYNVDYNRICAFFCLDHRYYLHGCRPCDAYNHADLVEDAGAYLRRVRPTAVDIDWEEWCREKCSQGDGGAACNCDILPMIAGTDGTKIGPQVGGHPIK